MNDTSSPRQIVDLDARRGKLLGPLQAVRRFYRDHEDDLELTRRARTLLTTLATYADAETYVTRVGQSTLERDSGQSERTVRRALVDLKSAGLVEVLEYGNGRTPSTVRLTLPQPVCNPVDNPTLPNREGGHGDRAGRSPWPGRAVTVTPYRELPIDIGEDVRELGDPSSVRCARHEGVDDPPPCYPCKQAREAAEAALEDAKREQRERIRREDLERHNARRAAAAAAPPPDPATVEARRSEARAAVRAAKSAARRQ